MPDLTGLSGVPSSPWKKSLRRSDELLSISSDDVDLSAADFNDDCDWAVVFSASLNRHCAPTENIETTTNTAHVVQPQDIIQKFTQNNKTKYNACFYHTDICNTR